MICCWCFGSCLRLLDFPGGLGGFGWFRGLGGFASGLVV